MAKTDLERAVEALTAKQSNYTDMWKYYDGDQPLVYSTQRLKEIFREVNARFSLNWCSVVIDSELDRIKLNQFEVSNRLELSDRLNELMELTELILDADDIHKAASVTGEAFAIAWKDADGRIDAYYNDPRLCHVFYDQENPRMKSFAAKWWVSDSDGKRYLTLYYPDRLEYYVSKSKAQDATESKHFEPTEEGTAVNPFNMVPVFHFRPDRRVIKSQLKNVIEPQNAYNKLFADMMIVAEFGAFKQRWIASKGTIKDLKNAPNEIWGLPEGSTTGEFSETQLTNFLEPMNTIALNIATVTRTPKHYFMAQGGDPSGEALITMEAPLNKKAQKHISLYSVTWRKLAAFLLQLSGVEGITERDIKVIFDPVETVQPRTQAEIRQINTNAGMPLTSTLREEGRTEEEIEQIIADRQAERAEQYNIADVALAAAERQFNAGPEGMPSPAQLQGVGL
jgi:hypothetical protein